MDNVFKQKAQNVTFDSVIRQALVDLASRVGVGQYGALQCPECEGGSKHERSLSLNVAANGEIKYHCHRAGCSLSGTVYSRPDKIPPVGEGIAAKSGPRPLTADLHMLSDREVEWFKRRFYLSEAAITSIRRTAHRYALPIHAPNGSIRGWITRRPWEGSPADTEEARKDSSYEFKSLTYMENLDPVQSWYGPYDTTQGPTYIVEDSISAMRLADAEAPRKVVSILGTGINAGKIAELQRNTYSLIIALDADATGQAFAMARKWGQAFDSTRVVVLSKDIKDCTPEELAELPL